MVPGPEFGLTPSERETSSRCGLHTEGAMLVAVLDLARRRRYVIMNACRGERPAGGGALRGAAQRAAPHRPAHLVAASLVAGRDAEPGLLRWS